MVDIFFSLPVKKSKHDTCLFFPGDIDNGLLFYIWMDFYIIWQLFTPLWQKPRTQTFGKCEFMRKIRTIWINDGLPFQLLDDRHYVRFFSLYFFSLFCNKFSTPFHCNVASLLLNQNKKSSNVFVVKLCVSFRRFLFAVSSL